MNAPLCPWWSYFAKSQKGGAIYQPKDGIVALFNKNQGKNGVSAVAYLFSDKLLGDALNYIIAAVEAEKSIMHRKSIQNCHLSSLLKIKLILTYFFITFCMTTLYASTVFADQKPDAPEHIQGITTVSAEQTIELILSKPDLVIIDSRKKIEFRKGHIEGAINILNTQLQREDLERVLTSKSSAVLFYCDGIRCRRSTDSIKQAKTWGYTKIFWFRGGWKEWTTKRLPVITN